MDYDAVVAALLGESAEEEAEREAEVFWRDLAGGRRRGRRAGGQYPLSDRGGRIPGEE